MTADLTHNQRISDVRPLVTPAQLRGELHLEPPPAESIASGRQDVRRVLQGEDDRFLVVVGPCSIHDLAAATEYATRLARIASRVDSELLVVMRCYFEKPRTTLGWKGLINDPGLDGSYRVNDGLRAARAFLLHVVRLGLPTGCEFLDPITPQYLADLVVWGSIGARTAHSQIHRQLASGLSMPVGIKNTPEGDVQAAVDAVAASAAPHVFPGVDDDGRAALFTTTGNGDAHIVLRGASNGPNYGPQSVEDARRRLVDAGLAPNLLIDASHGNSAKDPARQLEVVADVARRVAGNEPGIVGVMMESFLYRGRQDIDLGKASALQYGVSVTDACLSWEETESALRHLQEAVAARRVGEFPEPGDTNAPSA